MQSVFSGKATALQPQKVAQVYGGGGGGSGCVRMLTHTQQAVEMVGLGDKEETGISSRDSTLPRVWG